MVKVARGMKDDGRKKVASRLPDDVLEVFVVADAQGVQRRLTRIQEQLPVSEEIRDDLEPLLLEIEEQLKEIWREM